jgi:hypothetical protein
MPADVVDVFIKGDLFKQNAIIEYEEGDEPVDEHTPYHCGHIDIPFKSFQPHSHKPVIKRSNGKEYWLSLETGTIDLHAKDTFIVLDNSYELIHKPT